MATHYATDTPHTSPQQLAVLLGLLVALIWFDTQYSWLQPIRYQLGYILTPSQQVAQTPRIISQWLSNTTVTQEQLLKENQQLQARNLILELRSQRLASLETENKELRKLLNASEQVDDRVLVASIISSSSSSYKQQVTINKGGTDGVFIGQPVLDAYGLLGLVVDVMPYSAKVMLVADANHAVPVQTNRSGVRAVAEGTGSLDELELMYVPKTADIVVGDLLVSSGLGERYPKGYPVATVSAVENIPGLPFAKVLAKPSAQLDRSRFLLLVFSQGASRIPPQEIWQEQ